jgi:hypothetical protein
VYGPVRTVACPYSVCRSRGPVFVACSKVNSGSVAMYKKAKEDGEGGSDNTQNETSSFTGTGTGQVRSQPQVQVQEP